MSGADKPVIVVKIGGRAMESDSALRDLTQDIACLGEGFRFLLVHGGGAQVSQVSKIFGMEPVFKDGIRQTSPAEMDIVEMVLAGKTNKALVRMLSRRLRAVGLAGCDGGFFTAASIDPAAESRTGRITHVDPRVAFVLFDAGYVPVVASTSMDEAGGALNINADEAALEIARALGCAALVYLSDIPGILKEGKLIARINAGEAENEIAAGVITGGMIPKVRSSLQA
ncbi:MAG: acetylglutamate kinase, partial [Spirochaetaceae bacterium]|nr:acetylglutamate kinase [Spirochaetaceae bacterium]